MSDNVHYTPSFRLPIVTACGMGRGKKKRKEFVATFVREGVTCKDCLKALAEQSQQGGEK